MNTLLKVLLGLAALAVVLFVGLAIAVSLVFEPNDYRPYVVDAVESATGRRFELQGDLELALFPCCAVAVNGARLGNPEGFPDDDFAEVESAEVRLRLWPLLIRRQIEIGTVTLDGIDLTLRRLADGRDNWTFESESDPAQPGAAGTEGGATELAIEDLVLHGKRIRYLDAGADLAYTVTDLQVRTGAIAYGAAGDVPPFTVDGALSVTDESDGTTIHIETQSTVALTGERMTLDHPSLSLRVVTSALANHEVAAMFDADTVGADLGEQTTLEVAGLVTEIRALESNLRIEGAGRFSTEPESDSVVKGTFMLDETSPRRLLEAMDAAVPETADNRTLTRLAAEGSWSLTGNAAALAATLEGLVLQLDDSRLVGSVRVDNVATPHPRFELDLDRLEADRYLPASPASASPMPNPAPTADPTVLPLDALDAVNATGTLRIGALVVSGIAINDIELDVDSTSGAFKTALTAGLAGGTLRLDGASAGSPTSELAGTLRLEELSPRALLKTLDADVATANPQALSSFYGSTHWRLTPTGAGLDRMDWRLDGTRITGRVGVSDFDALATTFELGMDRFDLDGYLAPEAAGEAPKAAGEAPKAAGEAPTNDDAGEPTALPVEVIRDLDLDGRLRVGELKMFDITLHDAVARVRAADGILRLDPLTASLYGGEYRGTVTVDATGDTAQVSLDQELVAVQIEEVLQGYFDTDVLAGALTMRLAGSGAGNTTDDLLRGLGADVSFDLADGVYRGMDMVYELQRARALVKKEAAPTPPENPVTPIRTLSMQGRMADGVLQTRQLSAETSAVQLLGRGGLNLLDLDLDYTLDAKVLASAASAAKLGDLANLTLPLTLKGPIAGPKVGVDLQGLLTNTLRDTARQKAEAALLKRLGGDKPAQPGSAATDVAPGAEPAAAEPARKPSAKDQLRQGLKDLLRERSSSDEGGTDPSGG